MMTSPVHRFIDQSGPTLFVQRPRRALFLDRDGVINADHGYVHTPEQTAWIPGIFALCRRAIAAGYLPIVLTNQAGIARGLYSEAQFIEHTRWLHGQFVEQGAALFATFYCPHHPTEGVGRYAVDCNCRKPLPGMFEAAARHFDLDMAHSIMIGDKASDLRAAKDGGVGQCFLLGDHDEFLRSPEGCAAITSLDAVLSDVFPSAPANRQVAT